MDITKFDEAFAALPEAIQQSKPVCVTVLGSGWNQAIVGMDVVCEVSYADIPYFGGAAVMGHSGKLVLVRLPSGKEVLVFCGRRHGYEGVDWEAVVMPAEIARRLKAGCFLVTNAAGGIRADLNPGDIVVIEDHMRFMQTNPLTGPHITEFGDRFPDQSHVYTPELQELLIQTGVELGFALTRGIYVQASGPMFETPAEVRAYGILGADLVGMSTVPEAMFASACGLRVAGLSFVANPAAGISKNALSGEEVIECAKQNAPRMAALVREFLKKID